MYLWIFEDNDILQERDEPNQEAIDSIKEGALAVIRFNTASGKFENLYEDGTWQEV